MRELLHAFRRLRRTPGFMLAAALTLAAGIGTNTAIFSVVRSVLMRPLPYSDPGRLTAVLATSQRNGGWLPISPAMYQDWREQQNVFTDVAAAQFWTPTLAGSGEPERIRAVRTTGSLFEVLGVAAEAGRTYQPSDDREGAAPVAVLGNGLWKRRFGADPGIIGRDIVLSGVRHTVIGIMPAGFEFPPFWATGAELWAPLSIPASELRSNGQSLRAFARLKPGISPEQASAALLTISRQLAEAQPGRYGDLRTRVGLLEDLAVGDSRPLLVAVSLAVGLLLLIACANVTNLLLARTVATERDLAVRAALGAGRGGLLRHVLSESLLVAMTGGAVGILLAAWAVPMFLHGLPAHSLPRQESIEFGPAAIGFGLALSVVAGLLCGSLPAWKAAARGDSARQDSSRGSSAGHPASRAHELLVAAEVALSLTLLICAGLLLRSFQELQNIPPGFRPDHLTALIVPAAGTAFEAPERRASLYRQLVEAVAALPSVEQASAVNHVPLAGDSWGTRFFVEGRPVPRAGEELRAVYRVALPNYFRTMGARFLAGRDFTERDREGAPLVAVINATAARLLWPSEEAVGKRISLDPPGAMAQWATIAGVVEDLRQQSWAEETSMEIYFPYLQDARYLHNPGEHLSMTLVIRSPVPVENLAGSLRQAVRSFDRNLPIARILPMEDAVNEATWRERFVSRLLLMFAGTALFLTAVGVQGVVAFNASRRTREIGIRMALGATRAGVLRLVTHRAMAQVAAGVTAGIAGTWLSSRLLTGLLYRVSPTDPAVFAATVMLLAGVVMLASFVPAWRAARIDPATAIREP